MIKVDHGGIVVLTKVMPARSLPTVNYLICVQNTIAIPNTTIETLPLDLEIGLGDQRVSGTDIYFTLWHRVNTIHVISDYV